MARADLMMVVPMILLCSLLGAGLGYIGQYFRPIRELRISIWHSAFAGALLATVWVVCLTPISLEAAAPAKPVKIHSFADFETHVLNADQPVLVDFYADYCPPCRRLAPTMDRLAKDYQGRALIAKVDVQQLPQLAQQYGISGIPAVLFFQQGQEMERLIGQQAKSNYAQVLNSLGG